MLPPQSNRFAAWGRTGPRAQGPHKGARQEVKCFLRQNSPSAKSLIPGPWPRSPALAAGWEARWLCGGDAVVRRPARHLPPGGAQTPRKNPTSASRPPALSLQFVSEACVCVTGPSVPTPGHSAAG